MMGTPNTIETILDRHVIEDPNSGCWIWTGGLRRGGYGQATINCRGVIAHRLFYEQLVAPIPDGLVSHHICGVRRCVNPQHIEILSHAEHKSRHRLKVCRRGTHQMVGYNVMSNTGCRACHNEKSRRWRRKHIDTRGKLATWSGS